MRLASRAAVDDVDGRIDLVGAPAQGAQKLGGLSAVRRLAKDASFEHDLGVRPDDDRPWPPRRNRFSLRASCPGDKAQGTQPARRSLVNPGGNRLESDSSTTQHLDSSR